MQQILLCQLFAYIFFILDRLLTMEHARKKKSIEKISYDKSELYYAIWVFSFEFFHIVKCVCYPYDVDGLEVIKHLLHWFQSSPFQTSSIH